MNGDLAFNAWQIPDQISESQYMHVNHVLLFNISLGVGYNSVYKTIHLHK